MQATSGSGFGWGRWSLTQAARSRRMIGGASGR